MVDESERLFIGGRGDPEKFGWPIRSSAGAHPDPDRLSQAAQLLGRPVYCVDAAGYECEIIGAAISGTGDIGYVESRAKDVGVNLHGANGRHIDITIKICLLNTSGQVRSNDIESYNPFFGCDVRFFEWIGCTAIMIYREKHSTYACRFGDTWPPHFVKIEDAWIINGNVIGYVGYKQKFVQRLSLPGLEVLKPISMAEATTLGLHPGEP